MRAATSLSRAEQWREIIEPCVDNPALFVRSVIGANPDPWQIEAMEGFYRTKRAAIAGCHGSGKDALATWMGLFLMCTRPYLKGQCLGPGRDQLFDTLWPEFSKWMDHSKVLRDVLTWEKTHIRFREAPDRWFLTARTGAKRYSSASGEVAMEGVQGMHGEHLFIVITEASGVDDTAFDAAESCCTKPDNYLLVVGNALRREGRFYDIFHKTGFSHWYKRHVDYRECSHVDRADAERKIEQYGEDSTYVEVRLFGKFPRAGAEDAAIPWHVVRASMDRPHTQEPGEIQIGVDCARYGGDEFAIAIRVGMEVKPLRTWKKSSTTEMVGHVMETVEMYGGDKNTLIVVDEAGLGGGVVDPLIQQYQFMNVRGISNSMRPRNKTKYEAWDDEQWLEVMPVFLREGKLPDDDVLLAQLTTRKYEFTGKTEQQRRLESKERMKKRGIGSPDRAEAVMMCLSRPYGRASGDTGL